MVYCTENPAGADGGNAQHDSWFDAMLRVAWTQIKSFSLAAPDV